MIATAHVILIWCEEHKKGRWGFVLRSRRLGSRCEAGRCPDSADTPTGAVLAACVQAFKEAFRNNETTIKVFLSDDAPYRIAAGLKIRKQSESITAWGETLHRYVQEHGLTVTYEKMLTGDKAGLQAKRAAREIPGCHKPPPVIGADGEIVERSAQKEKKNVRQILGELGLERGKKYETLVLESVQRQQLDWISSVRLATKAEDHRKIDIVCESDYGQLYLQVKSSRAGAGRFREEYHQASVIECVVATPVTEVLDRRVQAALFNLRSRVLKARATKGADSGT